MAETYSTYTTLVQAEVDDTSSGARVVIQNAIKQVYSEILREMGRYLIGSVTVEQAAVVGARTVTPAEFTEVYSLHFKTSGGEFIPLREMLQDEYLKTDVNADNGTPTRYFINGGKIEFDRPCEAGTIRMELVLAPDILTGDSLIPDRFTNVVVMGACYRFFGYEKGPEAENYYAWYQIALRDMRGELSTRAKFPKVKIYGR